MSVNQIGNKNPNATSPAAAGLGQANATNETAKTQVASKAAAAAYAKQSSTPLVSDAANVQISAKAKEMSLAKKIVEDTPDVREDKIAHFKDLIAKGKYKPDAGKIADGMMREAMKDELAKDPDVALS